MMTRRRMFVVAAFAIVLSAREASGDIYHLKSPSTLKTEKGSELKLPPGYFLDEETWRERDEHMKKLEEDRTRFRAENESLRKSAHEGMSIPFATMVFVVGAFTGFVSYQMVR